MLRCAAPTDWQSLLLGSLLALLSCGLCVHGYPTGPPSHTCLSQQPFHLVSPSQYDIYPASSSVPSFVINVNSVTWTNGGTLTVTLVGKNPAAGFAGFIMRAMRTTNGYTNPNMGPLLGSFSCTTSAGPTVPCKYHSLYTLGGESNCVSHSRADDNMYQNVTCQWAAPITNEGPIMFSATVVVDYDNYQTQIFSPVISNSAGTPNFSRPSDVMTERPTIAGCGSTKTCALFPSTCESRSGACRAGVMMTKQTTGDLLFEVFGNTFDWLAVGFGDSAEMLNLEIITCGYDAKQDKVVLGFGITPGKWFQALHRSDITMVKTMIDKDQGNKMSLPVQPNIIYCQFVRPIDTTFTYYRYNSSTLGNAVVTASSILSGEGKFVVLANGQNVPNTPNLGKHTFLPLRSAKKFSANAPPMSMYFAGLDSKVKTHATLMTIYWLLLCGFGIIVARHTRPVLTHELVRKQLWFLIHVGCMVVGYVVAIAGVIYILVNLGKWETDPQIHGILGLIGMGLGLLNILAGIFRPHPGTKFRPIFNRLHRWNGLLAFVVSGVAIWLGATFNDHRPEFRFWAVIVLGIWSGLQIVFMVGFELARQKVIYNRRLEMAIDRRFEMTDRSASAQSLPQDDSATAASSRPIEETMKESKIKGKQLVHITDAWIAVYACTFLALAAAFWAGLWIH